MYRFFYGGELCYFWGNSGARCFRVNSTHDKAIHTIPHLWQKSLAKHSCGESFEAFPGFTSMDSMAKILPHGAEEEFQRARRDLKLHILGSDHGCHDGHIGGRRWGDDGWGECRRRTSEAGEDGVAMGRPTMG